MGIKMYKNSFICGIMKRIFDFAFTVGCGYLASEMLGYAMEGDTYNLIKYGTIFAVTLLMGLFIEYLLTKKFERSKLLDNSKVRKNQYKNIINNKLRVETIGEQEVLLDDITGQIAEHYQDRIPQIVEGISIIVVSSVLIGYKSILLGVILPCLGLVQLIPVFIYRKWTKKIYAKAWDADEQITDWLTEGIDGIVTLKSYMQESWFIHKYDKLNIKSIRTGNKSLVAGEIESTIFTAIDALLRYGSYILMGSFVMSGKIYASDLPIFVVLSGYIFSAMDKLFLFLRYQSTYGMALEKLKTSQIPQLQNASEENAIECIKVSKSMDNKPILVDVDLVVKRNEHVLVSGENGSGKSTIIKIILGETDASEGTIKVNGTIATCLQEEPLVGVSAQKYIELLAAQADWSQKVFINTLNGFCFPNEKLYEPINELSGGERKKLFLAFALARKSDILILDEPSNHLDDRACGYLGELLDKHSGTVIVSTHDERITCLFDKRVLMKGGRIEC